MSRVGEQLEAIRQRISSACERAGRRADDVALIAVSKTFPADAVREAWQCGQRSFGESRQQELAEKVEVLPADISWHFIGRIQSNKVRKILPLCGWIHAVDSLKLARYVNEISMELGLHPKFFLQVNQAGEESKGGFDEVSLRESIEEIVRLKNAEVVGLMTIPPDEGDGEASRKWFAGLRCLRDDLEADFEIKLPFLSMGMSGDFEVAIEEGATHVRVGSLIFGKREGKLEGELG
jgi:PLP dependent protein